MPYVDKTLTCRGCGSQFTFTAGEQTFYRNRGLSSEPGRCPGCRNARNEGHPDDGYVSYGRAASFGGRTPRQMHPATCARCGDVTEVPFAPRENRPVFCSDCFAVVRQQGGNEHAQRRADRD